MSDPYRASAKPTALPVFYVHVSWTDAEEGEHVHVGFIRAADRLEAPETALANEGIDHECVWAWGVIGLEQFAEQEIILRGAPPDAPT